MASASPPDPQDVLESYLAAPAAGKPAALSSLLAALRGLAAGGAHGEAARLIRGASAPTADFLTVQSLHRAYERVKPAAAPRPKLKLAVLGGFTTHQLLQAVELALFSMGGALELHEADYGVFRQEILDPDSELYRFAPDAVFLAVSWRDLGRRPAVGQSRAEVDALVEAELAEWAALWKRVHERCGGLVIQNTFDRPSWRQLDNHEMRHPSSFWRFVSRLNEAMADAAPPYVVLHDVDSLAAVAGRRAWSDERYFFHAKLPCAPDLMADYGYSVASLLAARLGLTKKCLVLDLDNTCWGGVIGDDGLGGIRLGQGGAEGEAYLAFQRYAQALRQRGVLLAVCSKNDERVAREVFEKHPEMVLRLGDISCFMANWNDKAANIREIAKRLNIGLDSLVFVDDNPAERAVVRRLVPEVAVPELPEDAAGYIHALEPHRHFQTLALADEDLKRTEYYRADEARAEAQVASSDIDGFLKSLAMTARVAPIEPVSLERAAQLVSKSNQFNLTTRRRSAAELSTLAADPAWLTRVVSLRDRFGDNGLISVFLAKIEGEELVIDTWLMSCRVLKRGVEALLNNHVARWARERGLARLRGEYIPTPKNALVMGHYAGLGYRKLSEEESGRTAWALELADWTPSPVFIEEKNP